jgi:hypothetical protein
VRYLLALLLASCATAGPTAKDWDRCSTGRVIDACSPADYPPLALDSRTWPFPSPPQKAEEPPAPMPDTPAGRLLKKLGK